MGKPNVVFMGAGSGFVESLSRDLFQMEGVEGGVLKLVDIDEQRLELSYKLTQLVSEKLGGHWKIEATTDRRQVLPDADYVINCIEVSGLGCVRHDNDIPLKYGVSQCIGDTMGPGGLFKALRTGPVWEEVLLDCEEMCPEALVLNYTNPMSILCLVAQWGSSMDVVGLCHSVQYTSRQLAGYLDIPHAELAFSVGGINHHAWFTKVEHNGEDCYPQLFKIAQERGEKWEKDPVRFDMMLHFGYFVTESSGHFSEYLPYYRKRPDILKEFVRDGYNGGEGFYAKEWPTWRKEADERRRRILAGDEKNELKLERSPEYASHIVQAIETNKPCVIHGNVSNDGGLIANLLEDGCVEVPCLVDGNGVTPTQFGALPPQLAALCRSNQSMFELAAIAVLERSKEAAIHSLMLDPLTSAVCSPAEIRKMTEELFEAEREFLPDYE